MSTEVRKNSLPKKTRLQSGQQGRPAKPISSRRRRFLSDPQFPENHRVDLRRLKVYAAGLVVRVPIKNKRSHIYKNGD
ncbi:hypothetical protein V6N13_134049 [Hibiscus sabdariffa]